MVGRQAGEVDDEDLLKEGFKGVGSLSLATLGLSWQRISSAEKTRKDICYQTERSEQPPARLACNPSSLAQD